MGPKVVLRLIVQPCVIFSMKKTAFLLAILGLNVVVHSQSIKGSLADPADNKPLVGATVTLTPVKDSNSSRREVSDSLGRFNFTMLPIDTFYLKASFVGYDEYQQIVAISDSLPNRDLRTL